MPQEIYHALQGAGRARIREKLRPASALLPAPRDDTVTAYGAVPTRNAADADGRTEGGGPHIPLELWPRFPDNNAPMGMALVTRLPREFQRRGVAYPGIAFFGRTFDDGDTPVGGSVASPEAAHPRLSYFRDLVGSFFALMWLTEEELTGAPTPDPSLGEDEQREPELFRWVPLSDPNAGLAPVPGGEDEDERFDAEGERRSVHEAPSPDGRTYAQPWNPDEDADDAYVPWAEPLAGHEAHVGGTCFAAQGVPEGLSPFYLEFSQDFVQLNIGTGVAQLDLERATFTWVC